MPNDNQSSQQRGSTSGQSSTANMGKDSQAGGTSSTTGSMGRQSDQQPQR